MDTESITLEKIWMELNQIKALFELLLERMDELVDGEKPVYYIPCNIDEVIPDV